MFTSKLRRLRQVGLMSALPDNITVPAFGNQRGKTIPMETALVDELAFCLAGLEREQTALRSLTYAVEEVLKRARRQGACGCDVAIAAAARDLDNSK